MCECLKCQAEDRGLLHSWGMVLRPAEYARLVADIEKGEPLKPIYCYEDWWCDLPTWLERKKKAPKPKQLER